VATDAKARLAAFLSSPAPDPADATSDLIAAAAAERMHLLLAARLRSIGVAEDTAAVAALYADERLAAVEDVARTRELVKVLTALGAADCRPIVFKGMALSRTHYGQPWWRPRLDTDMLVPEDRRDRAAQVFARLGYERPAFVSGRLVMYQEMFVRSEPGGLEHVVDLHWRVANRQVVADAVSHADLDARGVTITMDGVRVRVPCPADALVLACIHRAAHHHDAPDLLWLYDIHLLASRLSGEEWRAVVAVARTSEVAALCDRGLGLACEHFGTPVPPGLLPMLVADSREASSVFLRGDRRPVSSLRSDLRALGWTSRARLIRELLFPPPGYMRAAFGAGLLPWLYVRRATFGVVRWLRDPARHVRERF
jgi:hypothetical protein